MLILEVYGSSCGGGRGWGEEDEVVAVGSVWGVWTLEGLGCGEERRCLEGEKETVAEILGDRMVKMNKECSV